MAKREEGLEATEGSKEMEGERQRENQLTQHLLLQEMDSLLPKSEGILKANP